LFPFKPPATYYDYDIILMKIQLVECCPKRYEDFCFFFTVELLQLFVIHDLDEVEVEVGYSTGNKNLL